MAASLSKSRGKGSSHGHLGSLKYASTESFGKAYEGRGRVNMDKGTDDLSILDRPEILMFIFVPRRATQTGPSVSYAKDYMVEVEKGVRIGCRFFSSGKDLPNILFFHGNGEIVTDYDDVAPLFREIGLNLFVADYRGYGFSNGTPTISKMISDAHSIYDYFIDLLEKQGYTGNVLLMGRSLGSASAVELASMYQDRVKGVIIESGFADIFSLFEHLGFPLQSLALPEGVRERNLVKLQSIRIPTLVIHAQHDHIVPLNQGKSVYDGVSSEEKRFLMIPNADHNNIMMMGLKDYFNAIKIFALGVSSESKK